MLRHIATMGGGSHTSIPMAGASSALRAAVANMHRQTAEQVRDAFLERLRQAPKALLKSDFAYPMSDTRQSRRVGRRLIGTDFMYTEFGGISTYFRVGTHWFMIGVNQHKPSKTWSVRTYVVGEVPIDNERPRMRPRILIELFELRSGTERSPSSRDERYSSLLEIGGRTKLEFFNMNFVRHDVEPAVLLGVRMAAEQYKTEMQPLVDQLL
jgi:hypothetical protein